MPGHQRGFSLIELITVILLIGILTSAVVLRMVGRSSFDAVLNRDQAIAIFRQVQTVAMNQGDIEPAADPCHALVVSATYFGAPAGCSHDLAALTAAADQLQLSVTGAPDSVTRWHFNLLGRPYYLNSDGKRQSLCDNGCRLTFTSGEREQAAMVINREGYVDAE